MGQQDARHTQLTEIWTDSHNALVLTGDLATLSEIARRIGLGESAVVATHQQQAVLALWHESLDAYRQLDQSLLPHERPSAG
jgi:hypothetical protein